MPTISVDTGDLTRAIRAVVPHVETNENFDRLQRVRFSVAGPNLHVHATQRYTAAVALVSVVDHHTGEAGQFDLTPGDARELTRMFKPDKNAIDGEDLLQLDWTDEQVTVTDTAGLFAGKAATWPMSVDDTYPDVEAVVGHAVHNSSYDVEAGEFITAGPFLKAFTVAADVYGAPLVVMRRGPKNALVACGDSFLGVINVTSLREAPDGDPFDEYAWRGRLPAAARFQPADVEVRRVDDEQHVAEQHDDTVTTDETHAVMSGEPDLRTGRGLHAVPTP